MTAVAIEDLRTAEGEPVPVEDWPSVTGAAVILTEEWDYLKPATSATDGDSEEADDETDEATDEEDPEPVKVFTATWVVTDVEASGLVYGSRSHGSADTESGAASDGADAARAEEEAEAKRQERRTVIANNKAWVSVLLTALRNPP